MYMLNMILNDNVPTSAIIVGVVIIVSLILLGVFFLIHNPRKKRHL